MWMNRPMAIPDCPPGLEYLTQLKTDTCMRICCGNQRGFKFHVVDNLKQEVMMITREFKCCAGCCWCAGCCMCCAFEVRVEAPPGNLIGTIKQKGSFWKANYDILDETENVILKIEGPCCIWDGACCQCDNEFKLLTADGMTQIGSLTKEYAGFVKELVTLSDRFSISCKIFSFKQFLCCKNLIF
ncbi:phospholipid scramblase 2-like isoform X1 [Brachionus plicatilis]|uniref:Phospholipid scramblase n=1 Tax=Brachionus plicatilis TaxID=10195 RepID=A0A3M7RFT2_BRAPC|nr:phospholipid scramblase 2-like isoform X1 [Brachionus plicatilis]